MSSDYTNDQQVGQDIDYIDVLCLEWQNKVANGGYNQNDCIDIDHAFRAGYKAGAELMQGKIKELFSNYLEYRQLYMTAKHKLSTAEQIIIECLGAMDTWCYSKDVEHIVDKANEFLEANPLNTEEKIK